MKMMIMKIMVILPTITSMMKTPMSMGMLLMMQTFMSTSILTKSMSSSWMPMIMFLMLIGGLLILFMYMSSIASNEKFKMNLKMIIMPIITIILIQEELLMETQNEMSMISFNSQETMSLNMIFMKKYFMITILIFLMLLLTMISVVYIIKIYKGPLRAKTYE